MPNQAVENIWQFARKLSRRHAWMLGVLVPSVLGLITVAWTGDAPHIVQISLFSALNLAVLGWLWLLNYRQTMMLIKHQKFEALRRQRLERKVLRLEAYQNDYKRQVRISDRAFRDVAMKRTEFDNNLIIFSKSPDSDKSQRMKIELEVYLSALCDAAVEILASRNGVERDIFHANIKIVSKRGRKFVYQTLGRSKNTQDDRIEKDETEYDVESNFVFQECQRDVRRMHIIRDVRTTIGRYSRIGGQEYTAPTPKSVDYYVSSASKLLFIKSRAALGFEGIGKERDTLRNGQGDRVYGMMTIDSPEYIFSQSKEEDLGILEELSIQAHSALHFHNMLIDI